MSKRCKRSAAGKTTMQSEWWREGPVDRMSEHFELRYGDASASGWNECLPVALVSRDQQGLCNVEFLIERTDAQNSKIIEEVVKEVNFYLIELRAPERPDPWDYLHYHCGTCSNIYSPVHWSLVSQQTRR